MSVYLLDGAEHLVSGRRSAADVTVGQLAEAVPTTVIGAVSYGSAGEVMQMHEAMASLAVIEPAKSFITHAYRCTAVLVSPALGCSERSPGRDPRRTVLGRRR